MKCLLQALFILLVCSGCGGYLVQTADIRKAYEAGKYDEALSLLDKQDKQIAEKDRLLYLLDRGMVEHSANKFDQSIKTLSEADKLAYQLDVVSVHEEAGALLSNESNRAYRGESYEKLMISVLQALNYASLGEDEDALVEARRVNERIQKMVTDEKKPYEQLAIAKYLSAILYEEHHDYADAFIDYQDAFKLQPNLSSLPNALLRTAKLAGRESDYSELKAKFPNANDGVIADDSGEVLVVVEAGLSPEKHSKQEPQPIKLDSKGNPVGGDLIDVPEYQDRWNHVSSTVVANGQKQPTVVETDLESVAEADLKDRVGKMMLKSLASNALKAGVAYGAAKATKNEGVGLLTFAILSLSNRADTRSWLSLPAEFQIARLELPKGKQTLTLDYGGKTSTHEVTVDPGRVTVLPIRRY